MRFIVEISRGMRQVCGGFALGIAVLASAGTAYAEQTPFSNFFPNFYPSPRVLPWVQPDGKTLHAGSLAQGWPPYTLAVIRMNPDNTPDRDFGKSGMVQLTVWGAAEYGTNVAVQADGRIVVGGNAIEPARVPACGYYAFCTSYIAIFRLNADGTRDESFNGSGRLVFHVGDTIPYAEDGPEQYLDDLVPQADGTVVLYGTRSEGTRIALARILADGTLDRSFGPADLPPKEFRTTVAVEFYNARLDQYFVTADTEEIAGLDRRAIGWRWVDSGFHVNPPGSPAAVPVCRLYGRPEAGLSSHVLSANPTECAQLEAEAGNAWILESRDVFRVELPDIATGACAPGRAPVYRLWNGRTDSGHHLTIDRKLRDRLLARGYVAEGWGPEGVAMCAAY